MLDAPVRKLFASPLDPVAVAMTRAGIRASTITLVGFMMGLGAVAFIITEQYASALVFLALNRFCDILDGMIARVKGPTAIGGFLDATLDPLIFAMIPFAFALARQQDALAATFLLLGFVVAAIPVLSVRIFSTQRSWNEDFVLCGHTENFVIVVLICVAERWTFTPLAYLYGSLCFLSCGISIASAMSKLRTAARP
jgi:CDP-diacylglycerol--glycerol-3-phosphate 3-phosphatidyltransferase